MNRWQKIDLDFKVNQGNIKSLIFIVLFRTSNYFTQTKFLRIIGFPLRVFYRIFTRNIMGLEIWDTTEIGAGFMIWHGAHGSIIHPNVKIGNMVSLRQNTTIGSSSFSDSSLCPTIHDNVQIGANSILIGKIKVGQHSIIGAGAVVIKDVPSYAIVAGNPAKVIKYNNKDS